MRLELCRFCGRKFVPELLLATVDVPDCLPCVGAACSVQARVCRVKKNLQGEASATAVSEVTLTLTLTRTLTLTLNLTQTQTLNHNPNPNPYPNTKP